MPPDPMCFASSSSAAWYTIKDDFEGRAFPALREWADVQFLAVYRHMRWKKIRENHYYDSSRSKEMIVYMIPDYMMDMHCPF